MTRSTVHDVEAAINAGGNDFLTKPYDMPALVERIRYWTARRVPSRLIEFG